MFEPHEKIAHLGLEKARRYRQEADLARTLAQARGPRGWRWHFGEVLVSLAIRTSPQHRRLWKSARGQRAGA